MNSSSFLLNHTAGIIVVVLFLLTAAQAASFDCGKAATEAERLICDDQILSKGDEALAALYAKALKHAADPLLLKRQQREWLVNVRDACIDASSLREAYAKGIKELSLVLKTMSGGTAKALKSHAEACQVVADFANNGILDELLVSPLDPPPDKEELDRIFGEDAEDTPRDGLSYWRLDLNDDGILDHLMIESMGRVNWSIASVLSGKKGSTLQWLSDDEYLELDVLRVKGRYYVLSRDNGRLGRLWRLTKDGEFVRTCSLEPRMEPDIGFISGKENAVCSEAGEGRVHRVEYALSRALRTLPAKDDDSIDGLAQADINNDGTPDNVVRIDFSHCAGRCQGTYIEVTDEARAKIPETILNEILSDKGLCGSHVDAFVHKGVTYVDAQHDVGNRTIYRIKGDKAETICRFRGHRIYDVVDVVEESQE